MQKATLSMITVPLILYEKKVVLSQETIGLGNFALFFKRFSSLQHRADTCWHQHWQSAFRTPKNIHRTVAKLIQYDKQQHLLIVMPLPSAHLSTVTTSEQDKYSSWGDGGAKVPLVLTERLFPMAFQFAGNILCGVVAGLQRNKNVDISLWCVTF